MSKARNRPIQPSRRVSNALQVGLLFLILLLALGLRFYRLDAQSLWNDEGTSVAVAQRGLVTIARDAAQDIHPPLYYWLLSGWVRLFGTSEAAVRSFSALLGVILVALTYALGRLLAGKWAGLAAALLAAINPFQIYYSQEGRMYMLLAVLGALAFYWGPGALTFPFLWLAVAYCWFKVASAVMTVAANAAATELFPAALRSTMVGWQMITGAVFSMLAQMAIAALIGPLGGLTVVVRYFALLGFPSAVIFGLFIDETRGQPLEVAALERQWAEVQEHRHELEPRPVTAHE